jgi:hypothetical protein
MRKLLRLFFLFIIPGLFVSCETDFNVIANYKEVAIVYGLLNQNDTIHYLRINKAFLGEGNALEYAKIADSSSFGANINVVLTEVTPEGARTDFVFDTVTLYNKQPGDFYAPGQLFYASNAKLDEKNSYELKVSSKKTPYEVTSKTELIKNFYFKTPSSGSKTLNIQRSILTSNKFVWQNAKNGKRYQFKFYFHYKELGLSGDTTYHEIEWVFPEQTTESIDGLGESNVSYKNEEFYTLCENKIRYSDQATEDAVIKRFASTCDLEVTAIGDEFNTYLEANGPSTGVLIEKPSYSNITNGLGLFSCIYQIHRLIGLSEKTILDLNTTTTLKFEKPTK